MSKSKENSMLFIVANANQCSRQHIDDMQGQEYTRKGILDMFVEDTVTIMERDEFVKHFNDNEGNFGTGHWYFTYVYLKVPQPITAGQLIRILQEEPSGQPIYIYDEGNRIPLTYADIDTTIRDENIDFNLTREEDR